MMARLRHGIEYLFVLVFLGLVRLTPIRLTPFLARLAGRVARIVTPKRVRIANENLKAARPGFTPGQRSRIVKALYTNLAGNAVDSIRPVQMVKQVHVPAQALDRLDRLKAIASGGRPLIFVGGHYGAWELLFCYLASLFPNVHVLAKQQRNKLVDRLINKLRLKLGGTIVPSHRAPRVLSRLFRKEGSVFYFVGDQDGGGEGIVIDFLGRPTSYARGLALYSYRYDALTVPIFLKRENPGYTLEIGDAIEPDPEAKKGEEIRRIVSAYSDALAEQVRKDPEQWLWTHRRWKSTDR